jgi:hypothetical protein
MLIIHEQPSQGGTFSHVQYDIYSVLGSCYSTKFNTAQEKIRITSTWFEVNKQIIRV